MLCALVPALPAFAAIQGTDVGIGDYLQMGTYNGKPIIWRCVDIDDNGPLMLADKAVCVKCADSTGAFTTRGSHSTRPSNYPSNYWGDSNIRAWLNSDAAAGKVNYPCLFAPSIGEYKYDKEAGFLTNFPREDLSAVKDVTQKSILSYCDINNEGVTASYVNGDNVTGTELFGPEMVQTIEGVTANYDDAYAETFTDKMFLLDVKQLYAVYENREILGDEYYAGAYNLLNDGGEKINYWLRTPKSNDEGSLRISIPDGSIGECWASEPSSTGVRPAFYFNTESDIIYSGSGTEDDPYTRIRTFSGKSELTIEGGSNEDTTADLSKLMSYVDGTPTAGRFTYIIDGENTAKASIDGDILTVPKGLDAGGYSLTVKAVDKNLSYMLASDDYSYSPVTINIRIIIHDRGAIHIGEYIQLGEYDGEPILWRCVGFDENGPLLLSDKALGIKQADEAGDFLTNEGSHGNPNRRNAAGSNYYGDSDIRGWLNSDAAAGEVEWHTYPICPSYKNEAGFLANFEPEELGAVKEVTQKSIVSNTDLYMYENYVDWAVQETRTGTEEFQYVTDIEGIMANYDDAHSELLTDKMFLPDVKQLYTVYENRDVLGEDYYKGAYNSQSDSGEKVSYWLRTPKADTLQCMRIANPDGTVTDTSSDYGSGVRPAFYLDPEAALFNAGLGTAEEPYKRLKFKAKEGFTVSGDNGADTIADLSKSVVYENGTKTTADKFTYTIEGENTINASINGDILTIPKGLDKGEYSLTVMAEEKEPQTALASVGGYAYTPVTVNITVLIYDPGEIKIGEYVQMGTYNGPILWRCVDIDENGPLMLADRSVCLKKADCPGYGASYGSSHFTRLNNFSSNYWGDSNIRAWLNSDAAAGYVNWPCGFPPGFTDSYEDEAGFLTNFKPEELGAVKEVTQKTVLASYDIPDGVPASYVNSDNVTGSELFECVTDIDGVTANYDNAYAEAFTDKMFLLDVKQLYAVYENSGILGEQYYTRGANYWLRTANAQDVAEFRTVNTDGSVDKCGGHVYRVYGVRPAFYLDSSLAVFKSGGGTETNPYTVSRNTFGGEDSIKLSASYGYSGITADLSEYMAYENGADTAGKFTYTIKSENAIGASIKDGTLTIPKGLGAGEYPLTVEAVEKEPQYMLAGVDTYGTEPVTLNITVTIEKVAPTASVWANELVFKDRDQYLVTGKTDDGTLMYSTSKDGEYSTKIPTGKEVGEYTVWYKVIGDGNHTDSEPQPISVSIKNIESISITKEPANTTVLEGMPLDASGLVVTADCGDGETFEAHGYTLSGYDTTTPGDKTVTVTYAGKTATFNITVIAKSLTGIELTHKPDKLTYYQGDKLDIAGMVITAFYNNNTSAFINNGDCTVSGPTDNIGEQTVTVTYNGQTVEFTVTVLERPAPTQTVEMPLIETADFYGGKRVIISCATEGADIYYTADGTNPTTESAKYTAPIELTASAEIKAIAVKSGMNDSNAADESVTVEKAAAPVASVTGEVEVGTSVKLLCTTPGAEIYYTLGDSLEEDNYKKYTGEIVITGSMTIRAMAAKRGYAMSDGVTFTYTVAPPEEEPGDTNRVLLDAGESVCKAGRTFRLPAYVYSERAITDFRYTISFDSDKFEYVGFEAGDDVPVSDVSVTADEKSVTVRGTVNEFTAAEVCVLVFRAKPEVEVDGYVLPVSNIDVNTSDGSLTDIWYLEGYVTIIPEDTNIFADAYLTDAEDNILEYMEDVKGDLTAYILAQTAEIPENGEKISCDLILAFYDTNGALVMVNTTEAELSGSMDYFVKPITIPENTEIGDVKLMVWDKIGTVKPLTEVAPVVYPYSNDMGE